MAPTLYGPHGAQMPLPSRTLIMGVVNVTPDSFSDGGAYFERDTAVQHALELIGEGADVLDIGGESTRPGAAPVDANTECERVVPVIRAVRARCETPISIDTSKSAVAEAALAAGATFVNDVTALRGDPRMADLLAEAGCSVVLMHMLGTPRTMQDDPHYDDVVMEVREFLSERRDAAVAAGIDVSRLWIDPGIGFGKTLEHNLHLLRELGRLTTLGLPLVVGASRKSFLGAILDTPVRERAEGTAATVALAIHQGAAMVRVHDVGVMARVARVADAVCGRLTPENLRSYTQPAAPPAGTDSL